MFKKILVTLDGSPLSERALAPAVEIARKFGSQLVLLRVPVIESQMAMAYNMGIAYEPNFKAYQDEAEGYLYSWKMKLAVAGAEIVTEVVSGLPAETVLSVTEALHADLIVMSTHGRSGFSRLMYGSVAESVLRGSRVPVLLVPAKQEHLS